MVKNLPAMQETRPPSLGWEDPLEKKMATHLPASILAWRIPGTEVGVVSYSLWGRRVGLTHTCTHTHRIYLGSQWIPQDFSTGRFFIGVTFLVNISRQM